MWFLFERNKICQKDLEGSERFSDLNVFECLCCDFWLRHSWLFGRVQSSKESDLPTSCPHRCGGSEATSPSLLGNRCIPKKRHRHHILRRQNPDSTEARTYHLEKLREVQYSIYLACQTTTTGTWTKLNCRKKFQGSHFLILSPSLIQD